MTDNLYLNIAIGLVFIYFIYSLFATTVMEIIAAVFAHRHRMLERAIEQMLDGKSISYYWWDKVINFILYLINYRKFKAGNTGLIHNESLGFTAGFMDKQNLVQQPAPADGGASVAAAIDGVNGNVAQGKTEIFRRKLNEKAKLFAACFTEHPLYRRSAEQSLLYKKPSYISEKTFGDIMLHVLSGYSNENVSLTNIKAQVVTGDFLARAGMNAGLQKILLQFINQSNGSLDEFRAKLEGWFTETQKRVSGWYKKQTTYILFLIGFIIACAMNASTLKMARTLSTNKDAREKMVALAIEKSTDTSALKKHLKIDANITLGEVYKKVDSVYAEDVSGVNKVMGLGWDSAVINKKLRVDNCINKKINNVPVLLKAVNVVKQVFGDSSLLLGILLTAIAISLGAPFWFDLLNRFVNIRVAGKRPGGDKK